MTIQGGTMQRNLNNQQENYDCLWPLNTFVKTSRTLLAIGYKCIGKLKKIVVLTLSVP